MLRRVLLAVTAVAALFSFASAEINFDSPKKFSLKESISGTSVENPVPGAAGDTSAAGAKEWTIMVFVNGKNNLERFLVSDMNEMEQIGSTDKVNVVVEAGRTGSYSSSNSWKGTRRYLMQKDADTATITSPVVQDLGKTDMGDYKSAIAFGKWAKENYPARKYMLIIWNHGSGWVKAMGSKGISYDDETGNHINTPQMGEILKAIGGVDVYGSDACLMQMAEVDYEIMGNTPYIVGSEETEPGDGYTYNLFLGPLAANPSMAPMEVARLAMNGYSDHYDSAGGGYTQSVVKTDALPGFMTAVDAFTDVVIKANERALVQKARDSAQKYAYAENKDLYHFVQLLLASTKSEEVKAKGKELMDYITSTLVIGNRFGPGYSNSHGIAVYMPTAALPAAYGELAWAKASKWADFIKWTQQRDADEVPALN